MSEPLLRTVVVREDGREPDRWPWTVPVLRSLDELALHPGVTFLVGQNGTSMLADAVHRQPRPGLRRVMRRASEHVA